MTISRTRIPKEISMAKGHWIKDAIKKPGSLRKATGTKKGKNIPKATLESLAKGKGKNSAKARLALTLGKMRKKKRKG